jgi:hypothetical protein
MGHQLKKNVFGPEIDLSTINADSNPEPKKGIQLCSSVSQTVSMLFLELTYK